MIRYIKTSILSLIFILTYVKRCTKLSYKLLRISAELLLRENFFFVPRVIGKDIRLLY